MTSDLPIAVRVYPDLEDLILDRPARKAVELPRAWLVFDCETRIDATQALTFGCYRFLVEGRCLEEGLFYADDLRSDEKAALQSYVAAHRSDTAPDGNAEVKLLTLQQFLGRLYQAAYKGRCLLIAFNFPFDISRLAYGFGDARGRFLGGFSFKLWHYRDQLGETRTHSFRPWVAIKHIDSKRALKGFTSSRKPDEEDRIPEGSPTGTPVKGHIFRGHFLDLRTLAFALTDRGYSLEAACEAFGVEHPKIKVLQHGVITEQYIDYNRRDVLATAELAEKLLSEYDRHPISLQATRAYSPASIGKAYLRAMGIRPVLQRKPHFPKRYLGYAQSAFYGGRASAHIRKVAVPVVYTDFLSEYSTVNVLLGLWQFVIANGVRVIENCAQEVGQLLGNVSVDWLFDRSNWKKLTGFARVIPNGDVLPVRAKYGRNKAWQIGVNYLFASSANAEDGLWYSLPDLAASVLLSGKVPSIVEAFRIEPVGTLDNIDPVRFRGQVSIDPREDDFFRVVIEERKRLSKRDDLQPEELELLDKALKTLGSATSYGIFAQMDRQEREDKVRLTCYGIDPEPFPCSVAHPEAPGEFCFPPFASLITGAGHLLLALLERLVTDLGGTYAMEDTDSMAIVATPDGELLPCPGGPHHMPDGREAVRALSWAQVRVIEDQFAQINPYDPNAIPGSILKIEPDNFDPKTHEQRQLWCYAISAKRYALFLRDTNGSPQLLRDKINNGEDRWSEHGLGHLLNPTEPDSDDREWIGKACLRVIRKHLGFQTRMPTFGKLPAVSRTSVSSPFVMRSLKLLNKNKPYMKQVKPFNFLLSAHIRKLGYPIDVDPERFHLIAPFESDPTKWLALPWVDEYTEKRFPVTTSELRGGNMAALNTYGDVLRDYEHHEEFKCAGPDGRPCRRQTIGLLGRRRVRIARLRFIGKESNRLEDVEEGSAHDPGSVYTEYPNARREREEWRTKVVPKLRAMRMSALEDLTDLSPATIKAARAGRMPHPRNRGKLLAAVEAYLDRQRGQDIL